MRIAKICSLFALLAVGLTSSMTSHAQGWTLSSLTWYNAVVTSWPPPANVAINGMFGPSMSLTTMSNTAFSAQVFCSATLAYNGPTPGTGTTLSLTEEIKGQSGLGGGAASAVTSSVGEGVVDTTNTYTIYDDINQPTTWYDADTVASYTITVTVVVACNGFNASSSATASLFGGF